jgi:hypothetical protein
LRAGLSSRTPPPPPIERFMFPGSRNRVRDMCDCYDWEELSSEEMDVEEEKEKPVEKIALTVKRK